MCPDCGLELYHNTAAAVGVILRNAKGEVLFEKRAKEPRKNYLALPGGFVDADESLELAAVRECFEETGIGITELKYLCSFPNDYQYKNIMYKTCDTFFVSALPDNFELKGQESEVQEFVWVKIDSVDDVEKCPIAFGSSVNALREYVKRLEK